MSRFCWVLPLLFLFNQALAFELRFIHGGQPASAEPPLQSIVTDVLPDAVITEGNGIIRRAWLVLPTKRYDHAILGDDIEAEGVRVELASQEQLTFLLPKDSVFEDRYPRLVDVDNDGIDEIILVRSYLDRGAALVVLKLVDNMIEIMAESDPIGLSHRWLNPVGAGDFDQDGWQELAAVVTPHIGGMLTLYKIDGNRLKPIHQMSGFSNHRIGSSELGQSAVADVTGDGVPDLIVPSVDFHTLRLISVINGALKEIKRVAHSSPINTALVVRDLDEDGDLDLSYGLTDGRRVELILP